MVKNSEKKEKPHLKMQALEKFQGLLLQIPENILMKGNKVPLEKTEEDLKCRVTWKAS